MAELKKIYTTHCLYCGVEFQHRGKRQKFCCLQHGVDNRRKRPESLHCLICGKPFEPKQEGHVTCDVKCKEVQRLRTFMERHAAPPIEPAVCQKCKKTFTPKDRRFTTYCSPQCSGAAASAVKSAKAAAKRPPRECPTCKKTFTPPANNSKKKFCSVECVAAEGRKTYSAQRAAIHAAEEGVSSPPSDIPDDPADDRPF